MTKPTETTDLSDPPAPPTGSRRLPLVGGLGFLVAYLLVSPVGGALADRDLPLPDDPAREVAAYYAANPAAVLVGAALQLVSVVGLLVFAGSVRAGRRPTLLARIAVGAMVVSSAFSVAVVALAGDAADDTVSLLRLLGFYAGGAVHVVVLGIFVLVAAAVLRERAEIGRGVRIFGYVAGVPAVLSALSVAIYYANAFLPLGRVLCMVWTVAVGVAVWRRRR